MRLRPLGIPDVARHGPPTGKMTVINEFTAGLLNVMVGPPVATITSVIERIISWEAVKA